MLTQNLTYNLPHSLRPRSHAGSLDAIAVVFEFVTLQYFSVALLTILVYHSIITMDREVKYFWSRPCNSVSLIYFVNRYTGLLSAICLVFGHSFNNTASSCKFSVWTSEVTSMITVFLIEYILLLRVLALYHQSRKLAICLGCLLGLEAAIGLGLSVYGKLFEGIGAASLTDRVILCTMERYPPPLIGIFSWVIIFAYGLILLCLALYKAAEYWNPTLGFKGFHLVRVLLRDQVFYYISIVVCCILQVVAYCIVSVHPIVGIILSAAGSRTFLCILGGQLLINLKAEARKEPAMERSSGHREYPTAERVSGQEVSEIRFA